FASLPTSFQDVIRGLEPGEESSYLVMVGGKRDGQRVELKGSTSEVFVGRGANCQVQIDHASISPTHAKVRMDWAGITVYDLNSQTGVFINGVRIASSRKLHNGDEISFGIPTSAGGIKLILYDRNSISGDNWIGVPPPITIKNNEPTENKESKGSDKAKVEEKPISKDAASAAKAEITAKEPEKAEKKVEKTEAKADETQVQAGEIEEPAKNMLDMNRVLVAGLTIRDILFISMLLVFVLIFFVIGLSFL
ncbi:MAG: FHA domain-containing protein, partial [Blastocatellia bacterium]|nr:FHA domain-containing protein [Blastocatellia bacterium]